MNPPRTQKKKKKKIKFLKNKIKIIKKFYK